MGCDCQDFGIHDFGFTCFNEIESHALQTIGMKEEGHQHGNLIVYERKLRVRYQIYKSDKIPRAQIQVLGVEFYLPSILQKCFSRKVEGERFLL